MITAPDFFPHSENVLNNNTLARLSEFDGGNLSYEPPGLVIWLRQGRFSDSNPNC